MKSGWGWAARFKKSPGAFDAAVPWLRPIVSAAPWLTVCILILMIHLMGGALVASEGVLFELPDGSFTDGDSTSLVALAIPMQRQTLVFFDDARYVLGEETSMDSFSQQLEELAKKRRETTLLVLADKKLTAGDLMNIASRAKLSGIERILFAERRDNEAKSVE